MRFFNRNRKDKKLQAAAELKTFAIEAEATVDLQAAADGESPKQPTFKINAYNGGLLRVGGFYRPIVVDLSTLRAGRVTVLKDHNPQQIVGQGEAKVSAKKITVSGKITGDPATEGSPANEIVAHAKNGFIWAASIGVSVERVEYIDAGDKVKVNGQSFAGPIGVVRAGRLGEVSFVGIGADETAFANVAASAAENSKENQAMEKFKQWLTAKGENYGELDEGRRFELHAEFCKEQDELHAKTAENLQAAAGDAQDDGHDAITQRRVEAAAEETRISAVRKACGDAHSDIAAKAIAEGWTAEKAELEVLRASRASVPAIHTGGTVPTAKAVEAGLVMQSMSLTDEQLQAAYDEQTLDAAHKDFRRVGLKGLIAAACGIDGRPVPHVSAGHEEWIAAAFSTNSMSSIVSTSAKKIILQNFEAVPSAVRRLFKPVAASDFKTHTGYRVTGANAFNKVGQDGELKHATLSDESKTFSVDTYGEILGITRQMIINDDLGVLLEIPGRIGRDAARKVETVGMDLLKANTGSFFASGNGNYISGAATALSIAALDSAVQKMAEATDSDGNPALVEGKFLVVPPALAGVARRLFKASTVVATGTGASKQITANVNNYEGAFEPIVVPHLSATIDSTNGSDSAWYLWGDPGYIAPFALAFLNGVSRPTIEEIAVSGEYLGKAWRGFLDFGVAQWDEEGAVMSKGKA